MKLHARLLIPCKVNVFTYRLVNFDTESHHGTQLRLGHGTDPSGDPLATCLGAMDTPAVTRAWPAAGFREAQCIPTLGGKVAVMLAFPYCCVDKCSFPPPTHGDDVPLIWAFLDVGTMLGPSPAG